MNLGSFQPGDTIYFWDDSEKGDGTPETLSGSPSYAVYKNASSTESTAGITHAEDFDSVTGFNRGTIDTSADGTFYSDGGQFCLKLAAGTVDGVSVANRVIAYFRLQSAIPADIQKIDGATVNTTVAQLGVNVVNIKGTASAGVAGYVGPDWSHVNAPTTTVGLTGTTISSSQVVASVTGNVGGNVTGNVGGTVVLATSQPNYAPAKAGDQMDLINAPNSTGIAAIVSAVFAKTYEGSRTFTGFLRLAASALFCKTDFSSNPKIMRDEADTKTRISVDATAGTRGTPTLDDT